MLTHEMKSVSPSIDVHHLLTFPWKDESSIPWQVQCYQLTLAIWSEINRGSGVLNKSCIFGGLYLGRKFKDIFNHQIAVYVGNTDGN